MADDTIRASDFLKLDSDVHSGGGTDETAGLQRLLDKATEFGRLHLILDGAALISDGLKIYANTTIECPDQNCGLFLADGVLAKMGGSMLTNAHMDRVTIKDENITLQGGSYNQNAIHQDRGNSIVYFCGVRNLILRDVRTMNQRCWTMTIENWEHVLMENVYIKQEPGQHMDGQNQDGIHFFGPGRFLTMRNIHGSSGDDFIALASDEHYGWETKGGTDMSGYVPVSITDVLIDGVQLEEADQAIRLLSGYRGRLDRIVIRNVTGCYNSYGFIINPWDNGEGNYGNIIFDTIDLRERKANYDYCPPYLFKIGGRIESLSVRNVYKHLPEHSRHIFDIGGDYIVEGPETEDHTTLIDRMIVDGLYIDERNEAGLADSYFYIKSHIKNLIIKNMIQSRADDLSTSGAIIKTALTGKIDNLLISDSVTQKLAGILDTRPGDIGNIKINGLL